MDVEKARIVAVFVFTSTVRTDDVYRLRSLHAALTSATVYWSTGFNFFAAPCFLQRSRVYSLAVDAFPNCATLKYSIGTAYS